MRRSSENHHGKRTSRNKPERPHPVARRWLYLLILSQLCCATVVILVVTGRLDIYLLGLVPAFLLLSVPYLYNAVRFLRNEQAENKQIRAKGINVIGTILSVEETNDYSDEEYFLKLAIQITELDKIVHVRQILPPNTTMALHVGQSVPLKYSPDLDKALIVFPES
jgi:hypothetical protein